MTKFEQALADMHKQFADIQKRQDREHAEALARMEAQIAEFISSLKGE